MSLKLWIDELQTIRKHRTFFLSNIVLYFRMINHNLGFVGFEDQLETE